MSGSEGVCASANDGCRRVEVGLTRLMNAEIDVAENLKCSVQYSRGHVATHENTDLPYTCMCAVY